MADRVGQLLGHYQLIRLLGHGGFSNVYLGEHQSLRTLAALLQEHSSIPIGVIQIAYGRSHGRPIAHALPQLVKIEQSRSGTLPTGEMSLSTKDIPMMSQPLIGGPHILPQELMIKLYKYGMPSPGLLHTLIPATPIT